MKKRVLAALLAASMALCAGCGSQTSDDGEEQTAAGTAVEVAEVTKGAMSTEYSVNGKVAADNEVQVFPMLAGQVLTLSVSEGDKVTKGQTVEIRCELKRTGEFANTLYTIRYFQFEGEGTLKMASGITFLPNDRYLLENEKFRLYYTAEGDEAHNFIVVVEDNFKNSYELEFDFNNRNVKDDIQTVIPIGNYKPLPR